MSGSEEEIAHLKRYASEIAEADAAWRGAETLSEGQREAYAHFMLKCNIHAGTVAAAYLALLSQSHTAKERSWEEAARIADETALREFEKGERGEGQHHYWRVHSCEEIAKAIRALISSPRSEATSTPND